MAGGDLSGGQQQRPQYWFTPHRGRGHGPRSHRVGLHQRVSSATKAVLDDLVVRRHVCARPSGKHASFMQCGDLLRNLPCVSPWMNFMLCSTATSDVRRRVALAIDQVLGDPFTSPSVIPSEVSSEWTSPNDLGAGIDRGSRWQ